MKLRNQYTIHLTTKSGDIIRSFEVSKHPMNKSFFNDMRDEMNVDIAAKEVHTNAINQGKED